MKRREIDAAVSAEIRRRRIAAGPIIPRRLGPPRPVDRVPAAELFVLILLAFLTFFLFAGSFSIGVRHFGPQLDHAIPSIVRWVEDPCPRDPAVRPSPGRSCSDASDAMRRQNYERLRPAIRSTHIIEQQP